MTRTKKHWSLTSGGESRVYKKRKRQRIDRSILRREWITATRLALLAGISMDEHYNKRSVLRRELGRILLHWRVTVPVVAAFCEVHRETARRWKMAL